MRQYYTLEILVDFYRCQDSSLSEKVVEEKAKSVKKVLNTMDICWARSNRRFFTHNQLQNLSHNLN